MIHASVSMGERRIAILIKFLMRMSSSRPRFGMSFAVVVYALAMVTGCAAVRSSLGGEAQRGSPRFFAHLDGRESPFCGRSGRVVEALANVHSAKVTTLIYEATSEQIAFGGQSIDEDGRLLHAGFAEAEFGTAAQDRTPTWVRVDNFWASVPDHDADARIVRTSMGRFVTLKQALMVDPKDEAAQTSLVRAAAVDNPWSAAFISALEKRAGLSAREFAFSAAHADYVTQAATASEAEASGVVNLSSAYRACLLTEAAPQPGDLLCASRSDRSTLDSYAALIEGLSQRSRFNAGFAMHCELVVAVNRNAGFLEAIGGNVVQSVTRRRLALAGDGSGLLNSRYANAAREDRDCKRVSWDTSTRERDGLCTEPSLNDLSWVVLLQWRGSVQ